MGDVVFLLVRWEIVNDRKRTSMMHDVPRDFRHQLLEDDLSEYRWKDILHQVCIAFSNFVTYA